MKRSRLKRRGGLDDVTAQLVRLARGLALSTSRIEDRYWERALAAQIDQALAEQEEDSFNAALDHLYSTDARAYDELADLIEARAECGGSPFAGFDTVLIAAPILAWSRFRMPANSVPPAVLANLRVHLQAHVLASKAQLAVADFLFSPDQLPQGYCATTEFALALVKAAQQGRDLHIDSDGMEETAQFLSDTRYLLAAVSVPTGEPMFRWQERDGSRDIARDQWRAQGGACLAPLLPGCTTELVLPEPYFAACRAADKDSRPYSIRASVAFLSATLEVPAAGLRAVIAPVWENQLEEYRIGFTRQGDDQVVHGVVWPLLGPENEDTDCVAQIDNVLRESGVRDIVVLDHPFPAEYCEDCGVPLYPTPEGELAHAEMPAEQAEQIPRHLH